jgi:hypothetical protein
MQGPALCQLYRHAFSLPTTCQPHLSYYHHHLIQKLHTIALPLSVISCRSMNAIRRSYATVAHAPSRLRARGKSPLGLDHFIQRQRALALWRDIIRSTASISDISTRKDMRIFARAEFEQHKHVTDLSHIRYLISVRLYVYSTKALLTEILQLGKTQYDTMKNSLINSGILS